MAVVPSARHRRPGLLPGAPVLRGAAVILSWLVVVLYAPWHQLTDRMYAVALFVHLVSMVAGLGAVVMVDWVGLLWLAGRRTFADVVHTAQGAHGPTWLGFTGLLASGLFLGSPVDAKAGAVLIIGLNGVYAGVLLTKLRHRPVLPPHLVFRSAVTTAISQASWWTAAVLGFLNSR